MESADKGGRNSLMERWLYGLESSPEVSRHLLIVLSSLEKFQKEIQDCKSRDEALLKLVQFTEGWDLFHATAFYLVDEDLQFNLHQPSHPELVDAMEAFIHTQIKARKFAWALQQNREILIEVPHGLPGQQAILHGMSTRNTTLGVFVGFLKQESSYTRSSFLKILSIMIDAVVYVYENRNLLDELTQYNQSLEKVVNARTRELRHANQHLHQSNAELKKLNEKKSEFLGIVAHDLKNPLSGIIGLADLIADNFNQPSFQQCPNAASTREMLQYIHSSASHMVTTLNELMNSEIIESGHLKLDRVAFDLGDLAQKVVAINQTQALSKDIQVHLETASEVLIHADPIRIHEAIDNLVSNAIKYSPFHQSIWVKVTKEARNEGTLMAVFSVKDQGPGLTDDDKRKLFGRFQKLSARPTGGESSTGLGLSIVRNLIQLHGGEVLVESAPGQGSTFSFEIPLE
jgi:signal transduction histidine kinase